MNVAETYARTVTNRNPRHEPHWGAAVPSHLRFTLDLVNDPTLTETSAKTLFNWILIYFDTHPKEHTPANVSLLADTAVRHPDWSDSERISTLVVTAALQ